MKINFQKKRMEDIISEELQIHTSDNSSIISDNYDSDKNGYYEIDDENLKEYSKFFKQNDIKKIIPLENNNYLQNNNSL